MYVPHSLQSNDFTVFFAFDMSLYQIEQFDNSKGEVKTINLVNEGEILAIYTTESKVFTVLYHSYRTE